MARGENLTRQGLGRRAAGMVSPHVGLRAAAAVALALVLALGATQDAGAWTLLDEGPQRRAERISPDWRLTTPEGPGPHASAIALSGCDGVHDNMDFWAGVLAERGRATLIVDSHTPRDLDGLELWRLVCTGLVLAGDERAGDVAVALDALSRMDGVAGDVVLFGASHGGWAAMEFVALATSGEPPPGLTRWPAPPGELLSRVSALVLLYPYCGILNGADTARWRGAPPTLMVLAAEDSVVSAPSCVERAEELRQSGARVEVAVVPGADHGFDQREKSFLSALPFDAGQRDTAREIVERFLDAHAP